jgi:hypothetical protein
MYSCYGSSASDSNPLVGTTAGSLGLWRWYYGSTSEQTVHGGPTVASILAADGFASLPSSWISAVKTLIFSTTSTKIGYPKEKSTACASISKGA